MLYYMTMLTEAVAVSHGSMAMIPSAKTLQLRKLQHPLYLSTTVTNSSVMTIAVAFKHPCLHVLHFGSICTLCICAQRLCMPNNVRPTEPGYICGFFHLQYQDPMERSMGNCADLSQCH